MANPRQARVLSAEFILEPLAMPLRSVPEVEDEEDSVETAPQTTAELPDDGAWRAHW